MSHRIRRANLDDRAQLTELYREVAGGSGGLARKPEEISEAWTSRLLEESLNKGLILVLEESSTACLDGAVHAICSGIEDLSHVMGQLTILIRSSQQGQGLGKRLFMEFLSEIRLSFPFIYRVELRSRASSLHALRLYETLGFQREGVFRGRIRNREGQLEDGVPMVWFNPDWLKPDDMTYAHPGNRHPDSP